MCVGGTDTLIEVDTMFSDVYFAKVTVLHLLVLGEHSANVGVVLFLDVEWDIFGRRWSLFLSNMGFLVFREVFVDYSGVFCVH